MEKGLMITARGGQNTLFNPRGLFRFGQEGADRGPFGPYTWDITLGGARFGLVSIEVWEGGQPARFEAFVGSTSLGSQIVEPAGPGVGFGVTRKFANTFSEVTLVRVQIRPGTFDVNSLTFRPF
jgi:hypothetical protein